MGDLGGDLGSFGAFDLPTPGTPIDQIPLPFRPDFNPADQNGWTIAPAGTPAAAAGGGAAPTVSHLVIPGTAAIVVPAGVANAIAWEGDGGVLVVNYAAIVAGNGVPVSPRGLLRIRQASISIVDTTAAPPSQVSLLAAVLKATGTGFNATAVWTRSLGEGGSTPRFGANFQVQLDSVWDLRANDLDTGGPSNALSKIGIELAIQNSDQANAHYLTVSWIFAIDIFSNVG